VRRAEVRRLEPAQHLLGEPAETRLLQRLFGRLAAEQQGRDGAAQGGAEPDDPLGLGQAGVPIGLPYALLGRGAVGGTHGEGHLVPGA
jgi:hypothetical protein